MDAYNLSCLNPVVSYICSSWTCCPYRHTSRNLCTAPWDMERLSH